jgi:hypothetical protein
MQKLKRKSWSISKNSKIWKIKTPADRINLLIQTPHKEESEEYFTLPQSPNCNEDGRLESNRRIIIHIGRCCEIGNQMS